jgi:hypothetical protein
VTDIDTRAREAGAALLASVEPVATPRPRRSPLPRLAFAAIALLVIAASVLVVTRRDDRSGSTVTSGPGAPRLVVDPVPDGFALTQARDDEVGGDTITISTFGHGEGADLYRDSELMVGVFARRGPEDLSSDSTAMTVTVHGSTGRVEQSDYGVTLSLEIGPNRVAVVVSRTLTVDEVVQAADALRFDAGGAVTVEGVLPRDLAFVGTSTMSATGGQLELVRPGSHIARYSNQAQDASFSVISQEGPLAVLDVERWSLRSAVRAVDVQGRRGFIGTLEDAGTIPYRELVFEREDGIVAIGGNVTEDQLLAVAEHLRPAAEAEWTDASGAQTETVIPPGAKASLEGSLGARQPWTVYVDAQGALCASVQSQEHGSVSCTGHAIGSVEDQPIDLRLRPQTLRDDAGTPRIVYGYSPPGTARVVLDNGAQQIDAPTTPIEDRLLYAGALEPFPVQVVFFAADGTEISREPVT